MRLKRNKMEPFWKNKKYQPQHDFSKESYLKELEKDWEILTERHITALPSYSALKAIFKDMHTLTDMNLEEKKKNVIKRIRAKTSKRRKHQWQYKDFDEKLIQQIEKMKFIQQIKAWLGCFLEYYRLLKSENNNE
jgi:hypothetical protein